MKVLKKYLDADDKLVRDGVLTTFYEMSTKSYSFSTPAMVVGGPLRLLSSSSFFLARYSLMYSLPPPPSEERL